MRLLTATARAQGHRDNDFNWCIEGELVMPPPVVCAADRDDPDGGCGCGRAFAGLSSHKATTTAIVRNLPELTRDDLVEAVRSSLDQQGWPTDEADNIADDLVEVAAAFDTGTVVEQRLGDIAVRVQPPAGGGGG